MATRREIFLKSRIRDREKIRKGAGVLAARLAPLVELWKKKEITSPELSGAAILSFVFFLHGGSSVQGKREVEAAGVPHSSKSLRVGDLEFLGEGADEAVKWKELTVLDFISGWRLKLVPEEAARTLTRWRAGDYALNLVFYMPSTLEMLEAQCLGSRFVTLYTDGASIQQSVDADRHALEFLIHDLVHADHFFSHPELARGQRKFYRTQLEAWRAGLFTKALSDDPVFRKEWDYLVSDMNSHPLHLMKSFQAVVQGMVLREKGLKAWSKLDESSSGRLAAILEQFFSLLPLDPETRAAFLRINRPNFDPVVDAERVSAFFIENPLAFMKRGE